MAQLILIVDDDALLCEMLEKVLQREGYRVLTALTGQEALGILGRETPDLVLLDIMMPDINGFEIAGHIRADPRTRQKPVIMLTARVDSASRRRSRASGSTDYLTKPVPMHKLIKRIRVALETHGTDELI